MPRLAATTLALLSVGVGIMAGAADPEPRELAGEFLHRAWSRAEGMPDTKVSALYQSRDGFLWVGTLHGLARFDGREFKAFTRAEYPDMEPDEITSLAEDGQGRVWGLGSGFCLEWGGRSIRLHKMRSPFPRRLFPDGEGGLWTVGHGALGRLRQGDWTFRQQPNAVNQPFGAVAQDSAHRIWWGMLQMAFLDSKTGEERSFKLPDPSRTSGPVLGVSALYPHPAGGWLVVLSRNSLPYGAELWHFDADSHEWTRLTGPLTASGIKPFFSFLDNAGHLWMPDERFGLVSFQFSKPQPDRAGPAPPGALLPVRMERLTIEWPTPDDFPVCGMGDRDGNLWLGTEKSGLHQFVPKLLRTVGVAEGLPDENVWSVLSVGDGTIWVGTGNGLALLRVTPSPPAGDRKPEPAPSATGMPRAVLSGFPPSVERVLGTADGLISGDVRALARTPDDTVWIGTRRGLDLLREGRMVHHWFEPHAKLAAQFNDPQELGWNKIRVLNPDPEGVMWTGVAAGLHRIHRGTDLFLANPLEPTLDVRAVLPARDGSLWVGFDGHGLMHFPAVWLASLPQGKSTLEKTPFNNLLHADFPRPRGTHSLGVDPTQSSSLAMASPEPSDRNIHELPTVLTRTNGLVSNHIWNLYEDHDGVVWAGTESGLSRVEHRPSSGGTNVISARARFHVTSFDRASGLVSPLVNGLLEDAYGSFWIAHNDGIYRVARAELNAVASGKASRVHCEVFGREDGLLSAESNGSLNSPSACRTPDGRLWFATTKGVAMVDPARLREAHPSSPPAVIHQVVADEEIVWGDDAAQGADARELIQPAATGVGMELAPGRGRVLEFHYTAPTFVHADQTRFRYRLEGHEDTWHEAGTRRVAYYTNLRPGSFRFQVVAAGEHEAGIGHPATLGFSIAPYFWQTSWFWLLSGIGLAIAGTALVRWRLRELRRTHDLSAEADFARERIRIAQDLHDGLGSGLAQLRILATLAEHERRDPEALSSHLRQITDRAHQVADTLRDIIWVAHPQSATVRSLVERVCQHAEQHLRPVGVACRFHLPDVLPESDLGDARAQNLFYAAREVLTNILKHAGATLVQIRAETKDGKLVLEISDNGKGMAPSPRSTSGPNTSGIGLHSIRQRLEAVRGNLVVTTPPGGGSMVRMEVPFRAIDVHAGKTAAGRGVLRRLLWGRTTRKR